MIIPYYELRVKKYKTPFSMIYCLLQSCPEYTDPTVAKCCKQNFRELFPAYFGLQQNYNMRNIIYVIAL